MVKIKWLAGASILIMTTWTLVVKYLVPMTWRWSVVAQGGSDPGNLILWDFWPVAHLTILYALLTSPRWGYPFSLAVTLMEIAIILIKFFLFFEAPDWSFWKILWLTNKMFVLAFFLGFGAVLLSPWGRGLFLPTGEAP